MTDPDPDDSKVHLDEPTTALESALGPEDGRQVLQSVLVLRGDGHVGLRMTPIRDTFTWVMWLFWGIFGRGGLHIVHMIPIRDMFTWVMWLLWGIFGRGGLRIVRMTSIRDMFTWVMWLFWGIFGRGGLRIVRMTPIRDVFTWVMLLFWGIYNRPFPIQERHALVIMGHDYEVYPPRPDANYSIA